MSALPESIFFDFAAEKRKAGAGSGGCWGSICSDLVVLLICNSCFKRLRWCCADLRHPTLRDGRRAGRIPKFRDRPYDLAVEIAPTGVSVLL